MDQVVADRVNPVLARMLRRVALVEHVPLPVPETQFAALLQHNPTLARTAQIDEKVRNPVEVMKGQ